MSQFEVDHGSLRAAAKEVTDARSNTQGNLNTLKGVMTQLSSAWQGEAAGTFQRLMVRWDQDVNKLMVAMDEISDLLVKSANTHQSSDEEQAQTINRYSSALNG